MKRVVLAIAATLVLIALPAVAQYTDPSTTTQPTTTTEPSTTTTATETTTAPSTNLDTSSSTTMTTTETVDPNAPVVEERTNPAVPTHGPGSGLTASGSLVSSNDDEIVLRTATGITHFKLLPATTGVTTFTEGQRLTIDFTRNEQGVLIAQQVRSEGEASTMPVAETVGVDATETTASTTMTPSTTTESTTTTETTTETDTNLPETGSHAPLAGLLGLLALGGAAALRRL